MTMETTISTNILRDLVGQGAGEVALTPRRQRSKEFMYWRTCQRDNCERHVEQRGWVTVGPAFQPFTATEYVEFMETKHATPLQDYGHSVSNEMAIGPSRFKMLLEKGGIKEFAVDQLIAYGWHRMESVLAARPDVAAAVSTGGFQDYICEHGCPVVGRRARVFSTLEGYKAHVKVAHSESAAPEAVGRAIANNLKGNVAGNAPDIASIAAAVVAAMTMMQQPQTLPPVEDPYPGVNLDEEDN